MKKNIFISVISALLMFASCDDQLDIVPKGKTTLEKVSDLEALLNQEYMLQSVVQNDLGVICNECVGVFANVSDILAQKNTWEYANLAYDESIDRAALATGDAIYSNCYRYINYMNVIVSKMPEASEDDGKKALYIAEARIIRAYMHWLLVNIYAKQYDEATAEQEGGIAYVTDTDVSKQKTKLSLAETYRNILDDCSDEVIAQLPRRNDNVERPDQALGNAVRAKVLMQMKRYAEALPYAQKSLEINGTIYDNSSIMETMTWTLTQSDANNLLYVGGSMRVTPTFEEISRETYALFEEGDYVVNYDFMGGWSTMMGEMLSGLEGIALYNGWSTMGNPYGVTTDRMYYVAAECLVRTGKTDEGLKLVDRVRAKRVENATPFAGNGMDEKEAMAALQRAKWIECIGSYENFFDSKRWNSEANYRRTITRDLGDFGKFSIAPDSKLWVFPFPVKAVSNNPSLTQNY